MFSSSLTPSHPPSLPVLSLLLLDPPHWNHSYNRVLVKLTLAVHQTISLGSLEMADEKTLGCEN